MDQVCGTPVITRISMKGFYICILEYSMFSWFGNPETRDGLKSGHGPFHDPLRKSLVSMPLVREFLNFYNIPNPLLGQLPRRMYSKSGALLASTPLQTRRALVTGRSHRIPLSGQRTGNSKEERLTARQLQFLRRGEQTHLHRYSLYF